MSTIVPDKSVELLRDAVLASQRQLYLGSIAAVMAHEFSNFMTPVLARAQDALERDDVPAMRKALSVTVSQSQRAVSVVRRLLELAQPTPPEVEAFPVSEAVDHAVAACVREFNKDGIEFDRDTPAGLQVRANRLLFEQAIVNVLTHARESIIDRTGRIGLAATNGDSRVRVTVCDNGRRNTPERVAGDLQTIFAEIDTIQHVTADPALLALRACRLIVEGHRGAIVITGREGFGSSVTLEWPCLG